MDNENKSIEVWNKVLRSSLSIPGAKIDRASFLRRELSKRCEAEQVEAAINSTPSKANIPKSTTSQVAKGCIKLHLAQVTSLSFVAGLPGGWYMMGTIPADLSQFFYQAVQLSQKLAYIYGWPEFYTEDELDDETILEITLFIGVMFGAQSANKVIAELAERISIQIAKRLPRESLTKYGLYNLAKQVAKWIGVKLTKQSASRVASKIVPVLGGFVSGSVSYFTMRAMARRLNNHLASLPLANQYPK